MGLNPSLIVAVFSCKLMLLLQVLCDMQYARIAHYGCIFEALFIFNPAMVVSAFGSQI